MKIKNYIQFINENFHLPDDDEVKGIEVDLGNKYSIKRDEFGTFIIIDDKQKYLKNNREYLKNKIFSEIKDELSNYTEASIRKAIKNYLKENE